MKTWIASPADYEAMTAKERSEYRCAVDAAAEPDLSNVEAFARRSAFGKWTFLPSGHEVAWNWSGYLFRIAKPKPMEVCSGAEQWAKWERKFAELEQRVDRLSLKVNS